MDIMYTNMGAKLWKYFSCKKSFLLINLSNLKVKTSICYGKCNSHVDVCQSLYHITTQYSWKYVWIFYIHWWPNNYLLENAKMPNVFNIKSNSIHIFLSIDQYIKSRSVSYVKIQTWYQNIIKLISTGDIIFTFPYGHLCHHKEIFQRLRTMNKQFREIKHCHILIQTC